MNSQTSKPTQTVHGELSMEFRGVEGPGGSGNCHTKVSGAAERSGARPSARKFPGGGGTAEPRERSTGRSVPGGPGRGGRRAPQDNRCAPPRAHAHTHSQAHTHTHWGPRASPLPQNNKEREPGELAAAPAGSGRLRRRGPARGGGRRAGGGTYQAGSLGPGAVLLLPLVFHVCISLMVLLMTWGIPRGARGSGAETMTQ